MTAKLTPTQDQLKRIDRILSEREAPERKSDTMNAPKLTPWEDDQLYYDQMENETIKGSDLNEMVRRIVEKSFPGIMTDDGAIRPATEEEKATHYTKIARLILAAFEQFTLDLRNLTGCQVDVSVNVHSHYGEPRHLYTAASILPGIVEGGGGGSAWREIKTENRDRLTFFGPYTKPEAK